MAARKRRQFTDVFDSVVGPVTVSVNIASVPANGVLATNVTVPGARVGDLVLFQPIGSINNIGLRCHVSADDNVVVNSQNPTAGAIDPAAANFVFVLLRPRGT